MKQNFLQKVLLSLFLFLFSFTILKAQNATVYPAGCVGAAISTWPTIQQAVNAAVAGQCIVVAPGLYNEGVTIDKTLTLKGAQAGNDARTRVGAETIVNNLTGDFGINASNVVINGFTIQGEADVSGNSGPGFGFARAGLHLIFPALPRRLRAAPAGSCPRRGR